MDVYQKMKKNLFVGDMYVVVNRVFKQCEAYYTVVENFRPKALQNLFTIFHQMF